MEHPYGTCTNCIYVHMLLCTDTEVRDTPMVACTKQEKEESGNKKSGKTEIKYYRYSYSYWFITHTHKLLYVKKCKSIHLRRWVHYHVIHVLYFKVSIGTIAYYNNLIPQKKMNDKLLRTNYFQLMTKSRYVDSTEYSCKLFPCDGAWYFIDFVNVNKETLKYYSNKGAHNYMQSNAK